MSGGKNATVLLIASSLFWSVVSCAAEYTLDFTCGVAHDAEAPVLRRAEMPAAVGTVPAVAVGDTLNLRLFGDVDYALRIVSAPPAGIAGQSFIAKDANGSASAIVKVNEKAARISVDDFMNRRQYTVRCKDGKVLIVERDNSQMDDGECGTCGGDIEIPQPAVEETKTTSTKKSRTLLGASGNKFPLAAQKSVVDILVAFDHGAKAKCPSLGYDTIEEFADYAVNKMNTVLANSQLDDQFCYRLVGVVEIDGSWTTIDNALLLKMRVREGEFANLEQLRDKYGADTITLLINRTSGNTSGIGFEYSGNAGQSIEYFESKKYGCNVCDINTVYSRYTMSHETGHNMGCGHSNRQGSNSGPGRYSDSCGYHFTDANNVKHSTVMAYTYSGDDSYYYDPIPYFSTPDISPTEYGCALGVEGVNNNRSTLLQTHADTARLHEHVLPYDWDVKFLDDNGNEIPDGAYFYTSCNVMLTSSIQDAEIYYSLDGSTPTKDSNHCSSGTTIGNIYLVNGPKTITACAVTNGVAMSVRSITLRDGLTWRGDENGNGVWASSDSSEKPWSGQYFYGDSVVFPDLADISSATVTVRDAVSPVSVSFKACETAYTFDKGSDSAQINISDAVFAPAGDLIFNVPVKLDAVAFTNIAGRVLTFNAPFGQTLTDNSGYCTNLVTILPYGKLTVAPSVGKTQTFDKLNNTNGGFSGNATFRVGVGTVVFKGGINGGAGVIGRTKLEVGNGGELVFNMGGGTGFQMDQTSLTVEKGGIVRYKDMELLKRALYLDGGTIYAKRLDLIGNPGVYVRDDSSIENNGGGYILIRDSDSEINVSEGKSLTLNVGTQTDNRSDTSGWGIIKRGRGTIVANAELKHSGVMDIEEGAIEVGYSSGSTAYGQGWIVASNSTLRVKSGCTLKVPSLTLDPTSIISLPAATSAPLVVNGNVDLTDVRISIQTGGDLSLGASYPLISATGDISGIKSLVRESWPKLGTGLGWKVMVVNGILTASIVNAAYADSTLDFITNISGLRPALPSDATMTDDGGLRLASTPIAFDNLDETAVSITLDVTLGEPTTEERTICSWKIGSYVVRCVVTNGVIDCFWADNSHVANSEKYISLPAGRHVINIGYKSLDDNTYGGTFVYADGQLAYRAAGLRWSNDKVSRVTIGASAAETPAYKYDGLVVNSLALLTSSANEPLPNMTSSGGAVEYSYFAGKPPCVFALTPDGGFETYGAVLSAGLASPYEALSVSVVASFPENATGTIFSSVVRASDSYVSYATQVEYRGDGVLAFRDNGGSSLGATCKVSADMASPHLYTMTYKMGVGFKLYMDGEEVMSNSAYFQGKSLLVLARVVFGCGYWTDWMTSYDDNPNPISNLKVYASHIALGTDDHAVSETAVKEAAGYEPADTEEEDLDPEPPETPAVVDVLVAFDNGAQAYVANKSQTLEEFAAVQIGKMNDVLVTNKLDRFYSYRLAGVCKVDATYTNIETVSGDLVSGEGPLVTLRSSRELYGADTVTLLVNTSGGTLGDSIPLSHPTDVASRHECAFSVCSIRAVDTGKQHTMIHENAHNMGCGHARAQSIINSPFEYGRGYYFKDGNMTRHTIMAYGGDNDASWYFSTASKEFGFVLGDKTNNNARVLKETCGEVAKWREDSAIDFSGIELDGVTWQTSKKYPWYVDVDGFIRSYNQTDYTYQCTTPLKATIVGPKRLSFKHKSYFGGATMAGNNYSHFDVLLDDSPVLTQTECTNEWTDAQLAIPEGIHDVTFVFSQRFAMNDNRDYKDGTPEADDAVWIKDIAMEETPVEYVIFSNTNAAPNRASFTVSGDVKISIPAVQRLGIATGALVRLTSLDFGQVTHDVNYSPAARILITDGTTTWTSAIVATNETDRFPKMATNNDVVNRLVYSFVGANCILTVGAQYDLELQDASGNKISKIRYAFATNGEKIIAGMDMTSNGTTYTPMMQLKGEIAALAPIFDWTPGSAPTGWVSSWAGEHHGSTHEIIGPDGLATNLYVAYFDGNGDSQKWIPYQGSPSPEKLTNYTFLAYGNIDAVAPSAGNMGVLWGMGHNGNQKTMLVKDSSGNVRLVQANGDVVNKSINAGPVEGYHLFTVRFSEASGASLQIDNGAVNSDSSFTQVSDRGLQIGSILGGLTSNFERGVGFAVLKMLAFGTDSIPTEQYRRLCEEYPAVTNRVLAAIGETKYYRLAHLVDKLANDLAATASFSVTEETEVNFDTSTIYCGLTGESYNLDELGIAISDGGNGVVNIVIDEENITHECVLRISEIMPKPTDALNRGALEGMDVNGLESGWVEVENMSSDKWADLADYRFIRVNRGKKTDPAGFGNFPSRLVPPRSRAIFYTSERYSNSKDQAVSAFEHGTFDGKPMVMGNDLHNILVWGDKVNPKKSPYVRLYYAPGGDSDSGMVVDTVVVPSDLPEGWSIIVGQAGENEGTRRWLCPTPTRGRANTSTDGLKRIGPNVGPLYEKKGQKKTDLANEFAVPVPSATPGEGYVVTLPVNGVMNPDGTFTPRAADKIQSLKFVFRKDLDDSTLVTNNIDMATKTTDANWGDQYTATIPASYFPAAGHLMQWKVLITDGEGVEWTSPSFNNPDDGYEWYGTIVEPDSSQTSAALPTWHMFASGNHLTQMDVDADKQDRSLVPNQARVAIYDSSTSNYYDYVRIDLRGNTSAGFTKKGHGLRFAKAHPLTMTDVVTGEPIEEIRKTSLISEFADPSYMRQMIAFWLWRKMGNLVPFDFPVRCNLNGEFYQLAFNSERFTDELIEDVYGLDKFGYGYKNVGTLKSGSGTTAGGIEKKTPDDENESDITVLQNELRSKITAAQQVSSSPDGGSDGLDNSALTKFVVQKFNLPAWLNYLASARITQEMDDVWANVCIYYDNPDMKEGARGTGTWMPLGYDFNLTFGQHYRDGGMGASGLKAQDDWFKCHPFYGGNRVRCYASPAMTSTINNGNDGFESVLQSAKFRRLYLRRLRTLMDQQLKEPGTAEGDTPFMAKMREMADFMRTDAALDLAKWPDNGSDDAIDVWPSNGRPANMDAGIQDIWNNYVVPRREHLYVTHSVTNTAKEVGYGSNLNAGIPEAQSPIETLAPNISISNLTALDAAEAEALGVAGQLYDTEVVVIRNDNAEVVDMSGWRLAFSVDFTFPAGTVCDANDSIYIVADRRAYVTSHSDELTDQVIVGNATFTGAGPVALYDADGALVYSAIPQTDELKYLRLHSFYGNTLDGGDAGEWFALTNISDAVTLDLAGVTVCFLKQGDPEEGTAHSHVTLENKKGKGSIAPLKSWTASQADYSDKGWEKIQNNKQQITIYDKYGSVCQSLKVTQKNFPLAYGKGGYLVCDSTDARVTSDSQWHEALYELPNNGESSEPFDADSQEEADELVANAKPALTQEDVAAGLETQYLKVVAEPVEGSSGKYKAAVVVNPETVEVPVMAQIEDGETTIDPLTVESDEEGSMVTVGVSNATVGLWYGFIWTDSLGDKPFENDVESFKRATSTSVKIESKAEAAKSAQKAFFRVKVLPAKPK